MIYEHLATVLQKYRSRGIILDSNLLVLLLIGATDPSLIKSCRPTRNRAFTAEDFELLSEIVERIGKLITTPHILAETFNLLDQVKNRERESILDNFATAIRKASEMNTAAVGLITLQCFPNLGVTDCAIVDVARSNYIVMTIDAPLALELAKSNVDVINFNWVRPSLRS